MDQNTVSRRRKNGEGSIYQLKNGKIGFAITLGKDEHGKRIRKVMVGKTESEVRLRMRTLLENEGYIEKDRTVIVIKDFIEEYFKNNIVGKVKRETEVDYRRLASYFEITFGGLIMKDITKKSIKEFNSCNKYSDSIIKKINTLLKKIFEEAKELEIIQENPFELNK